MKKFTMIIGLALMAKLIEPAQAFPWKGLAQSWWGGPGPSELEGSGSYEAGTFFSYLYFPEISDISLFRVFYETTNTAFVLERTIGKSTDQYALTFLCISRWDDEGVRPLSFISTTYGWFPASDKAPIKNDNEYYTLTAEQILARMNQGPWATQDHLKPIDCKKWYDDQLLTGPNAYFKNYGGPYHINYAGHRTPFPRSGF